MDGIYRGTDRRGPETKNSFVIESAPLWGCENTTLTHPQNARVIRKDQGLTWFIFLGVRRSVVGPRLLWLGSQRRVHSVRRVERQNNVNPRDTPGG